MEPRAGSDVRCAYCHDPAREGAVTCPGCRTVVHADCRATHGGCPTLGCGWAPALPAPRDERAAAMPAALTATRPRGDGATDGVRVWSVLHGLNGLFLATSTVAAERWFGATLMLASVVVLVATYTRRWQRWRSSAAAEVEIPTSSPATLWGTPALATTSPRDATDVLRRLGVVDGWATVEDADELVASAQGALRISPDDVVARLSLALAWDQSGAGLEAEAQLRAAIERLARQPKPSDAETFALALARGALEERAQAIELLDALVDRRAVPEAWLVRARLRRCAGDLAGATSDADEATRLAADDDPWPFEVRGRLRARAGDLVAGLADLDEAVRRAGPRRPWPFVARGVARVLQGDRDDAIRDLQTAAGRALQLPIPRLWLAALGDRTVRLERLPAFDAHVALCLRGELDEAALLAQAGAPTWGERSRRRRLRRAHGLLGVAAEVRGDAAAAAAHAEAVRALGDDGSLECDWAWCRKAQAAGSAGPSAAIRSP